MKLSKQKLRTLIKEELTRVTRVTRAIKENTDSGWVVPRGSEDIGNTVKKSVYQFLTRKFMSNNPDGLLNPSRALKLGYDLEWDSSASNVEDPNMFRWLVAHWATERILGEPMDVKTITDVYNDLFIRRTPKREELALVPEKEEYDDGEDWDEPFDYDDTDAGGNGAWIDPD
jgi:hypothetical protein